MKVCEGLNALDTFPSPKVQSVTVGLLEKLVNCTVSGAHPEGGEVLKKALMVFGFTVMGRVRVLGPQGLVTVSETQ